MRVIVRRERPLPGALLRVTDLDGNGITREPPGAHYPRVLLGTD